MDTISFETTKEEFNLIQAIVLRANAAGHHIGTIMDGHMDVSAVHMNDIPLRLTAFLEADNFNFAHDYCGIQKHLNRETGKLENCFVPRFAKPIPWTEP